MPISQNQRLKKAAAKAAKRKAVVAGKLAEQRKELTISKPRHINLATSPIVACTISEDCELEGIGMLTVARSLSLGRYGLCQFLIDFWCVGVKGAYFRVAEADEYEDLIEQQSIDPPVPIEPARARRLLRDAAAYGLSNGVPQPENLVELERILGDVEPEKESTFGFGDDGRPHYVVGVDDTPQRQRTVVALLTARLGTDGFDFSAAEDFDEQDENDDEAQYDYIDEDGEIVKMPTEEKWETINREIDNDPELLAQIEDISHIFPPDEPPPKT